MTENNENNKFWYVHNRKMGNPTRRHTSFESALEEAHRLSEKHKKNFYVLASVCKVYRDGKEEYK